MFVRKTCFPKLFKTFTEIAKNHHKSNPSCPIINIGVHECFEVNFLILFLIDGELGCQICKYQNMNYKGIPIMPS
jgi:hypothetical protein